MQAIQVEEFGSPEVLKLKTTDVPQVGENQVLVRVKAVGVNPIETYIRSGSLGPRDFPYTPGGDCAGVVEAVGEGVNKFKPGDRVYTWSSETGVYAEMTVAKLHAVSPLPAQGASIGIPYGTAYKALHNRANMKKGEKVLVHGGSGAVGVASIQIAKAFGLFVIATAGTRQGMDLCRSLGADHVVCHRDSQYCTEIQKITEDKGVDIILEMLASANLQTDLEMLAFRGRIVVVGSRGTIAIDPKYTIMKESAVLGVAHIVNEESEWDLIRQGLEEGQDSGWLSPVVGREYALSDAAKCHNDIINNSGSYGKLVLIVSKITASKY